MASAFSSLAYSPLTRLYTSIPKLAPPSSSFTSQEQLKTSYAFSFRVPKNRSRLPVLFMRLESEVIASSEVTSESWNPLILKGETLVLVEFYTSWCEPCKLVHQTIDEIATDYVGKLKRAAVNVDHEPRVADEYDIKVVPIVLLFKNGEKCESVIGTMPKDFFVAAIERVLAS